MIIGTPGSMHSLAPNVSGAAFGNAVMDVWQENQELERKKKELQDQRAWMDSQRAQERMFQDNYRRTGWEREDRQRADAASAARTQQAQTDEVLRMLLPEPHDPDDERSRQLWEAFQRNPSVAMAAGFKPFPTPDKKGTVFGELEKHPELGWIQRGSDGTVKQYEAVGLESGQQELPIRVDPATGREFQVVDGVRRYAPAPTEQQRKMRAALGSIDQNLSVLQETDGTGQSLLNRVAGSPRIAAWVAASDEASIGNMLTGGYFGATRNQIRQGMTSEEQKALAAIQKLVMENATLRSGATVRPDELQAEFDALFNPSDSPEVTRWKMGRLVNDVASRRKAYLGDGAAARTPQDDSGEAPSVPRIQYTDEERAEAMELLPVLDRTDPQFAAYMRASLGIPPLSGTDAVMAQVGI